MYVPPPHHTRPACGCARADQNLSGILLRMRLALTCDLCLLSSTRFCLVAADGSVRNLRCLGTLHASDTILFILRKASSKLEC